MLSEKKQVKIIKGSKGHDQIKNEFKRLYYWKISSFKEKTNHI